MQKIEFEHSPIFDARFVNEAYSGVKIEEIENFRRQALRFVSDHEPFDEELEQVKSGLEKMREDDTITFSGELPGGVKITRIISLNLATISEIFKGENNVYIFCANMVNVDNFNLYVKRGPVSLLSSEPTLSEVV